MTQILIILGVIIVLFIIGITIYDLIKFDKIKKIDTISFKESLDLTDLPIITLYNNGKRFNFLLDTGASLSVIDSNILNKLQYSKVNMVGTVFGMEGNKIDVEYIGAELTYKNKIYYENFQVVDMSAPFKEIKSESGVTLSGILGNSFFTKYKYILDFNSLIAYSKK